MRPQDRPHFLAAASEFRAWILVRRTNDASLPYIGRPGFTPKPIDCKAKTADLGDNAGLVVRPSATGSEYEARKVGDAREDWVKFAGPLGFLSPSNVLAMFYKIDDAEESPHRGAIQHRGRQTGGVWCYIHGDYDLYDIIPVEDDGTSRANLALLGEKGGQPHNFGRLFWPVQEFVNARIRSPMIQHAGDFQFRSHRERDKIDAFGPNGEQFRFPEDVPSVTQWYARNWPRRRPVGTA